MNYYNEFDKKSAAWIRELIMEGHIPEGVVDERNIKDVKPHELTKYTQCHFFAGIGGWSLALKLAGYPDNRPAWTGSCPCQPFSYAGTQEGEADERHLWPTFFQLIKSVRPAVVFGEQVASKLALPWLDGVFADLEGEGYACAANDICAPGVGAPHIRQRLYWVANAQCAERWKVVDYGKHDFHRNYAGREETLSFPGACNEVCGMANMLGEGLARRQEQPTRQEYQTVERDGDDGGSGVGNSAQCGVRTLDGERIQSSGRESSPGGSNPWANSTTILCRDGKTRRIPVEPELFPLAHGVPGRVGLLRGYGNAIVPPLAAEFVKAAAKAIDTLSTW